MSDLLAIYKKLYRYYGPQHWWPADSGFEMACGAILTQNTSWANVERAIANLKKARCLSFEGLSKIPLARLARLIRPAGYYNLKAKRLKSFVHFLRSSCQGRMDRMKQRETALLRRELLSVKGIGPETADSILLYAFDKPVFVVDAYTKRICHRHKLIQEGADYEAVQDFFMKGLSGNAQLFNEYHALIVRLAKDFCKKKNEKCSVCPLVNFVRNV